MLTMVLALAAAVPASAVECPQADPTQLHPADLLDREETFRDGLSPADRERLDAVLPRTADGARVAACAGRDGTGCDAHAYLVAFKASGLMPRFQASLCPPRG